MIMGDWIPIVYYGTEQGFDGSSDPNNRESLWPFMSTGNPLYKFIKTLANFRRALGNEWLQEKQVMEINITLQLFSTCINPFRSGRGGWGGGGGGGGGRLCFLRHIIGLVELAWPAIFSTSSSAFHTWPSLRQQY